ncbi:DUF2510 domain-containing protein [Nocardioides jensenii]|uniref:DUF2510 domain-containing protein n=1 Tax=Nocardioides jensenii TaxID=1843 RepID=UPI0014703E8C|nr:DUF2510 domain-containing protein [Nocardioides jensenii]
MSQPAWYPDPSGQPGSFRYWNGQSWSAETTTNPYDAPPAGAGPSGPPQPSQQQPAQQPSQEWPQQGNQQGNQQQSQHWPAQTGGQWSPMPAQGGPSGGSGKRGLWIVLIGLLLVVLIVGGIIAALTLGGDDDKDDKKSDDSSQSSDPSDDPTTEPTDPESDDPETDQPTDPETSAAPALESCAVARPAAASASEPGRVASGGISFPLTRGYSDGAEADRNEDAFDFLTAPNGQMKVIERTKTSGWISMVVVGSVKRSDGYTDVQQAATSIAGCTARSARIYRNVTDIRSGTSEALDVGGHDAWRVDSEVEINEPGLKSTGDSMVVVAVETGDPETFAIFVGVVPLGNDALLSQLNETVAGITVD